MNNCCLRSRMNIQNPNCECELCKLNRKETTNKPNRNNEVKDDTK